MSLLTIILITAALIVFWIIVAYNSLVRKRNRVDEAWSDIDVQLKRRYNLIPNLVEVVKGYASHERQVFENVTQARAKAMGAKTLAERNKAENVLSSTLKTLFAVAENYPQLRASENFKELQEELTDTEDKIQAARRFYNGMVQSYLTATQTFPSNILASFFGFKSREFFGIEEGEREPVKVKF